MLGGLHRGTDITVQLFDAVLSDRILGMIIRGTESSLHIGADIDFLHLLRVKDRVRIRPDETQAVATGSLKF